jgi:hypothetical protein
MPTVGPRQTDELIASAVDQGRVEPCTGSLDGGPETTMGWELVSSQI